MPIGDPIKLGSASIGSNLVPQPGSKITTNVFGTDTLPLVYLFSDQSQAMSLRPVRGAAYSGTWPLSDFKAQDSDVEFLEGNSVRMTVIYKRPNLALGRINELSSDLKPLNGFFVGGKNLTLLDLQLSPDFYTLAFPEPVLTSRYVTSTKPNVAGLMAAYMSPLAATSLGFPTLNNVTWTTPTIYFTDSTYSAFSSTPTNFWKNTTIVFQPTPLGWNNVKLNFTEWCKAPGSTVAYFYEVTEVWRTAYSLASVSTITHP